MTLFDKAVGVSVVGAVFVLSAHAVAAPMEHTIKLQASVPTATFVVLPSDPGWIGDVQVLSYNSFTGKLGSFSKPFNVKNTTGAINAHLTAEPLLAGPNDNIKLAVKFNNAELTETSSEVVSATQAKDGHIANLDIIPVEAADAYKGGTYAGNVHISFDAMVTPPAS